MRLKARVAAVVAAGTMFVCTAPATAQQQSELTCADFPTQVILVQSVFPQDFDTSVLDPDGNGIGCEDNPGPADGYNALVFPPVANSDPPPPLEVSPTSGRPGAVITVHGTACLRNGFTFAIVGLVDTTTHQLVVDNAADIEGPDAGAGGWTGQLMVPAGVDPDDGFAVRASCHIEVETGSGLVFDYDPVAFDVTGPPAAPSAPPAAPVVAQPTFTG